MTRQLNLIARVTPQPRHRDAARAALCAIVPQTRAEPGCIEFRVSESEAEGCFYLYEEWINEEALESHYQQDYTRRVFASYDQWLAKPVEIHHLRPLA